MASIQWAIHGDINNLYGGISLECTSATTISWGPIGAVPGYYQFTLGGGASDSTAGQYGGQSTVIYLFEPDYDDVITVTAKLHGYPSTSTTYSNMNQTGQDGRSTLTLMEIVAT